MNFAKFLRALFLKDHLRRLLLSKMWLALQFSIFRVSSFIEYFFLFYFNRKNKKREISWWSSNIYYFLDLLGIKDFKRNLANGNLVKKRVLKRIRCWGFHGFMLPFFMFPRNFAREWFLGGENLTSSSTKTAQTINFKFCAHIFNWVLHNSVPAFFLILRYLFFMVLGKFLPGKFPPIKLPPQKIPT